LVQNPRAFPASKPAPKHKSDYQEEIMAHYGVLGSFRLSESDAEDIRGSHVYGINDEKLGKIDDVIFDHSSGEIRYAVIDAGGWLSSKKFLVPAERLRTSAKHKDDFQADLNKVQIEGFPPYRESDLDSEKTWGDYERRYRSKWETGPVMHRVATDRNITPTTQQMTTGTGATGSLSGQIGRDPGGPVESEPSTEPSRVVAPAANSVTISNSAMGIGGRWDTFQSRLRERRKEAVLSCRTCTSGPASERAVESVETQRKAI
jgi:sporulation protein YlmC with PRC-barrel domain